MIILYCSITTRKVFTMKQIILDINRCEFCPYMHAMEINDHYVGSYCSNISGDWKEHMITSVIPNWCPLPNKLNDKETK